jgi:hypothetical protein
VTVATTLPDSFAGTTTDNICEKGCTSTRLLCTVQLQISMSSWLNLLQIITGQRLLQQAATGAAPVAAAGVVIEPMGGDLADNLVPWEVSCPGNSFVTGFTMLQDSGFFSVADRSVTVVAALDPVTCSDGSSAAATTLTGRPKAPSNTLALRLSSAATGYAGLDLYTGAAIDAVTVVPVGSGVIGVTQVNAGGRTQPLSAIVRCPGGYVVTGLFGNATQASHIVTVGLRCKVPPAGAINRAAGSGRRLTSALGH